jgi:glucose/arabinose dehydrogenase
MLAACLLTGLVAGCSDFPDQASPKQWSPQTQLAPETGPVPQEPGDSGGGGGGSQPQQPSSVPPPQGCKDFNPAVIGTCMGALSAVAALPGNGQQPSALVAERGTGRVLQVSKGTDPTQVAKLPIQATGGGGLTGLALSPNYDEDQLMYAYVTTASDNEVVRFAAGQAPKPVLKGIPKGSSGNGGALALDHKGALIVATGDAGDPKAAANPKSLAGKVLRIAPSGKPAPDNPNPSSPVLASGVHDPGGLCSTLDGDSTYVTDRAPGKDAVFRVDAGKPLNSPLWTWPARPGVAGCAAFSKTLMIAASKAGNMQSLTLGKGGAVTGDPQTTMAGKKGFGRLSGMDIASDQYAVAGTMNKAGGKPVSSDDRAVIILQQQAAGSGKD